MRFQTNSLNYFKMHTERPIRDLPPTMNNLKLSDFDNELQILELKKGRVGDIDLPPGNRTM